MPCCAVLSLRKFDKKSYRDLHPGGKIGKKLKLYMNNGHRHSCHCSNASLIQAVLVMTEKIWMCRNVDKQKKIKGIITDGDLRRSIGKLI